MQHSWTDNSFSPFSLQFMFFPPFWSSSIPFTSSFLFSTFFYIFFFLFLFSFFPPSFTPSRHSFVFSPKFHSLLPSVSSSPSPLSPHFPSSHHVSIFLIHSFLPSLHTFPSSFSASLMLRPSMFSFLVPVLHQYCHSATLSFSISLFLSVFSPSSSSFPSLLLFSSTPFSARHQSI